MQNVAMSPKDKQALAARRVRRNRRFGSGEAGAAKISGSLVSSKTDRFPARSFAEPFESSFYSKQPRCAGPGRDAEPPLSGEKFADI
jgi:hypothetical protein